MQRADLEAKRLKHDCVDTEHILFGLLYDTSGVAAAVLSTLQIHAFLLAMELESLIPPGTSESAAKYRKRTAGAESVLRYASEAVRELGHHYIGTEHLLLGLLCEREGLAARVLAGHGLTEKGVREEIKRLLKHPGAQPRVEQTGESQSSPLRDAEREFFLGIYRSAVDFYKPRIEKRTGVKLGDIAVWDYDCLLKHVMAEYRRQTSLWRVGVFRWFRLRRRVRDSETAWTATYADRAAKCAASYYRSGIYVSFSSGTTHEEMVARGTVHELSHAIWETLAGVPFDIQRMQARRLGEQRAQRYNLLVEGFATYAERVWFLDLYPVSLRDAIKSARFSPGSAHFRGLRHVEQLVQQHGPQILMEIPRQWRDL